VGRTSPPAFPTGHLVNACVAHIAITVPPTEFGVLWRCVAAGALSVATGSTVWRHGRPHSAYRAGTSVV